MKTPEMPSNGAVTFPPGFLLRSFWDPPVDVAPGVTAEIGVPGCIEFKGSREALLAAGVVTPESLPSAPGQRKTEGTGFAGGRAFDIEESEGILTVVANTTPAEDQVLQAARDTEESAACFRRGVLSGCDMLMARVSGRYPFLDPHGYSPADKETALGLLSQLRSFLATAPVLTTAPIVIEAEPRRRHLWLVRDPDGGAHGEQPS